ncbi:DUF3298 and DUF4163 domain-containing protein [Amphibacillus sp. MSJ-3]|uniref:DUF3298 and DUF4163 domain-containing protein n=1 Tax=Amphibacillus sp. MSJ-3 TaxID=2841505 RepID=UPI001C0F0C54|nr:DUF3298 and DUF4163 domain-containing protein [Amphibacillus sp. MSJ-3]MBU5594308.1 DUF3298 and DUF4163 domain-containing protein [Amphibacillus sp. MSJ-3]
MRAGFPINIQTLKISDGPRKTVYYPQVIGVEKQSLARLINQAIVDQTQQLIDTQVANMPAIVEEMIGLYELKNNQRQVLSLSLSNYTYHHQAAHGLTIIKALTFDLKKERLCQLKDLFKPGSAYIEKLSHLINDQIKQREIPLLGEFEGVRPDQDFYIADKTLVIYFQLYDLAPYVFGFPMFPISVYDLQDMIKEDSPLGRMAASQ